MPPLLLRGVNLTPEQRTRVDAIMAAHCATARTLAWQLRTARDELAAKSLAPGTLKAEKLTPQIQKIAQLREQLLQDRGKATLEIREVLSPDQLGKAAQVQARLRALRAAMRSLLRGQP